MYFLFGSVDRYELYGGAEDFLGIFPTLADATTFACKPDEPDIDADSPFGWWHVAELRDGKLVVVARSLNG